MPMKSIRKTKMKSNNPHITMDRIKNKQENILVYYLYAFSYEYSFYTLFKRMYGVLAEK